MAATGILIKDLAAKTTLSDDDLVVIGEGSDAKKMTIAKLKELIGIDALNTKIGGHVIFLHQGGDGINISLVSGQRTTKQYFVTVPNTYSNYYAVIVNKCTVSTGGTNGKRMSITASINDGNLADTSYGNIGDTINYLTNVGITQLNAGDEVGTNITNGSDATKTLSAIHTYVLLFPIF